MATTLRPEPAPGLHHLLDPDVLADPYPLYDRLREWDPVLLGPVPARLGRHALRRRGHGPAQLLGRPHARRRSASGDGPRGAGAVRAGDGQADALHGRAGARPLARPAPRPRSRPRRVERLRAQHPGDRRSAPRCRSCRAGGWTCIGRLRRAAAGDRHGRAAWACRRATTTQLKAWSADFAEMLGNFQHNPDRAARRAAQPSPR